jgi:hypothetical protein
MLIPAGANTPERIRTSNLRFRRPMRQTSKHNDAKDLRHAPSVVSHHIPTDTCQNNPELAAVIRYWDRLPEAIRAGIVAMVKAAAEMDDWRRV